MIRKTNEDEFVREALEMGFVIGPKGLRTVKKSLTVPQASQAMEQEDRIRALSPATQETTEAQAGDREAARLLDAARRGFSMGMTFMAQNHTGEWAEATIRKIPGWVMDEHTPASEGEIPAPGAG